MDKSAIILSAETQFAREVTLGVIYQLPLPLWTSLIPGMFIFDFLRRNRAISHYTKYFMFPRKLALNAAQSMLNSEKISSEEQIQNELEHWLKAQNLLSQDVANAYKKTVELLIEHYTDLINTKGSSYNELVENAYKTRTAFQKYLDRLESAEAQIDQSIVKLRNTDEKFKKRLKTEAEQVKLRRNKILETIF